MCKSVVCKWCQPERNSGMVGAQWYFDHLKHLHAPEFQLEDCVCQCDFGRISLRLMCYVPPMSLRKSARKRQICWWARDIHKNIEHKEKPANPAISRVCEPFGVVPVAGVEPARVISPTDFESASSANSNTPASIILSHLPMPHPRKRRDIMEGH